jgi:toxin ParE1/3/4
MSLQDLDEIWDYIALESCNSDAAQNTVNGIMDTVEELKQFTGIESRLYFEDGMDSGYRYVQYKNYITF